MSDTMYSSATPPPAPPIGSARDRIIDALLDTLATRRIHDIGLGEIARAANVSLAEVRGEFDSVFGILAAHVKRVDKQVLDGGDADSADETVRERLFDVLMRRLEALAPHRAAMRSLIDSAARHPSFGCALNGLAVRSMRWMLEAAGVDASGPRGGLRAQGLSLLFAKVMGVFVEDQDPGLARTMAALDRELARGARWSGMLDDLCCIPAAFCRPGRWRARRYRAGEEPLAAA